MEPMILYIYTDHQRLPTENEYQITNEAGGGDCGEDHEYHMLEGPGRNSRVHQNRQLEMKEVNEIGEEHAYHVLEGPGGNTHVNQDRQLEMREVNETGEEHEYHVLEGPGGDGARKEPGVREVGGVMDYEIPLPLKKQ